MIDLLTFVSVINLPLIDKRLASSYLVHSREYACTSTNTTWRVRERRPCVHCSRRVLLLGFPAATRHCRVAWGGKCLHSQPAATTRSTRIESPTRMRRRPWARVETTGANSGLRSRRDHRRSKICGYTALSGTRLLVG
jgi:hypothetical protein